MPQFCILFYAFIRPWRPKGEAMAQCPPLNTPLHRHHRYLRYAQQKLHTFGSIAHLIVLNLRKYFIAEVSKLFFLKECPI